MNVKIVFDSEDGYICFVKGIKNIVGYGDSESEAIKDFLSQCENNPLFNQKTITHLLAKL